MIDIRTPLVLVVMLTGCATSGNSSLAGKKSTQDRLGSAIISPLNDLNIVQTAIPPVISAALKDPYQLPTAVSCPALVEQIQKLDAALGADLDARATENEKDYMEKGQSFVEDEAIGSVERTINGVIPFRSWIRKFTGAEKHSKEVKAAIAAGVVRRAFLKGLGHEHGCAPPAAPLKRPPVNTVPTTPVTNSPSLEAATDIQNTSVSTLKPENQLLAPAAATTPAGNNTSPAQ